MSLTEVHEALKRWREAGRKAGVATLVRVRGSAPRPPGARFAANEEGEVAGSVSSGCVESDLYEHIQSVLTTGRARVVDYRITDEMAVEVGLSCGGEIEVLVAPDDSAGSVGPELERALAGRRGVLLLTGLSETVRARSMLAYADGRRVGTLGAEPLDARAVEAAASLLETGGARVLELESPTAAVFAEALLPPPRLAIVGATAVGEALCRLAADLGIEVTVIDPRSAFARRERFPDAADVLRLWPEEAFRRIGLDRSWSVVVLAHDRKLDLPALAGALQAGCLYVGQIGGARTQALRRDALAELGFDPGRIARVHGPVGLEIGAETPAEIALSILAELLAVRRGRRP